MNQVAIPVSHLFMFLSLLSALKQSGAGSVRKELAQTLTRLDSSPMVQSTIRARKFALVCPAAASCLVCLVLEKGCCPSALCQNCPFDSGVNVQELQPPDAR